MKEKTRNKNKAPHKAPYLKSHVKWYNALMMSVCARRWRLSVGLIGLLSFLFFPQLVLAMAVQCAGNPAIPDAECVVKSMSEKAECPSGKKQIIKATANCAGASGLAFLCCVSNSTSEPPDVLPKCEGMGSMNAICLNKVTPCPSGTHEVETSNCGSSTGMPKHCCVPNSSPGGGAGSAGNTSVGSKKLAIPKLNVKIPGLVFSDEPITDGEMLVIPFLGQYISAFYQYIVGIGLVVAAVIFTYSAFLYLFSATGLQIADAKKKMIDALIGLVIILGSYVILSNINVNTTIFGAVKFQVINPLESELGQYSGAIPPSVGLEGLGTPVDSRVIIDAAKEVGINPCLVLAVCHTETGLKNVWNGIASGGTIDQANSFGVCQVGLSNVLEGGECRSGTCTGVLAQELRKKFPDFPAEYKDNPDVSKTAKRNYLLTHPDTNAYAAAWILKRMGTSNELIKAISYNAGSGSVKAALGNLGGGSMALDSINSPESVGITKGGIAIAGFGDPDPDCVAEIGNKSQCKGCPKDKGKCNILSTNASGESDGVCPTPVAGKQLKCKGANPYVYASNVINSYKWALGKGCKN